MANKVFVCPVMNVMGPVTDSRHSDLLNDWDAINNATDKYFSPEFRSSLIDDSGKGVAVSWFPISWSGFEANPVKRDFGWFTIYDRFVQRWGKSFDQFGDGVYWMYNHPDKSRVGNVWGLDWLENSQYLNILNRMVLDRGFFPGVIEIPTAETHSANFVESFFPFDMSNRNAPGINWDNIEADGKRTRDVIQWADAPDGWLPYHPSAENHQVPGKMRHFVFRVLDIKTRILTFPLAEVKKAFEEARAGSDVIIAGYEHDFRDRSDAVSSLFLKPIAEMRREYPDVLVFNRSFQEAAIEVSGLSKLRQDKPSFKIELRGELLLVRSDTELFSANPYACMESNGIYTHMPLTKIGKNAWGVPRSLLPSKFQFGVAGFSTGGRQRVANWLVSGVAGQEKIDPVSPKFSFPMN